MKNLYFTIIILLAASPLVAYGQNTNTTNSSSLATLQLEMQEMHDLITWGAPATNGSGVQIGVFMFLGSRSNAKIPGTGAFLYNTNNWLGYFPPSGYRLSLSLKDADGNDVKKTKQGEAISKPTTQLTKHDILQHRRKPVIPDLLTGTLPKYYEGFTLLDCFKVEKPGTNTLTVGGTVYKLQAGVFNEIILPPVSIQLPITRTDLDRDKASKENVQ